MPNLYSNPCTRCGKERIIVRTWKETVGYSVVTTRETACPDKACQKMVEQANKKQIDKQEASRLKRKMNLNHSRKTKKSGSSKKSS